MLPDRLKVGKVLTLQLKLNPVSYMILQPHQERSLIAELGIILS